MRTQGALLLASLAASMSYALALSPAHGGAPPPLPPSRWDKYFAVVAQKANATIAQLSAPDQYPDQGACHTCNYSTSGVGTWTCGFFPATLWKLYNYTTAIGDASAAWWRQQAQLRTLPIAPEENDTTTHDIGFMLFYTFGQGFDLTGDSSYRDVVFTGAGSLATRFVPAAGVIRSWNGGPGVTTIIDNMMNLPLLWWSGIEKGNQTWTQMAESHSNHMISDGLIREDGCAYHVIIYNETTGAVLSLSSVPQGFNATSIWSRGQAWAIHGFTTAYRYTGNPAYLRMAQNASTCFIRQLADCCADNVPKFDFLATGAAAQYRDTSAGAIAASGLTELAWYTGGALGAQYRQLAESIVDSLTTSAYLAPDTTDAVLLHAFGGWPSSGVDVPLIYGDYYFLEAIYRLKVSQ